jgi:hypothetical protein
VKEIRIYFEGTDALRAGFSNFFRDIRAEAERLKWRVRFVAAKADPVRAVEKARRSGQQGELVALKDSEGPREILPDGACFYMVQLMESWFLAELEALEQYYDREGFRKPGCAYDIESIPKADVLQKLAHATSGTSKGTYSKTRHAPRILERIDPAKVRQRSRHSEHMFARLRELISI